MTRSVSILALAFAGAAVFSLSGCQRGTYTPATDSTPSTMNARGSASDVVPGAEAPSPTQAQAESGLRALPRVESLSDTFITGKVKADLIGDPAMAGADVSVNTSQGVVNLTGTVTSQEQAAIASSHAQRQDGVMRIDNHLAVNLH
jgi:osmotically-inducible protein OsmY